VARRSGVVTGDPFAWSRERQEAIGAVEDGAGLARTSAECDAPTASHVRRAHGLPPDNTRYAQGKRMCCEACSNGAMRRSRVRS
jgi:hypothetical protein